MSGVGRRHPLQASWGGGKKQDRHLAGIYRRCTFIPRGFPDSEHEGGTLMMIDVCEDKESIRSGDITKISSPLAECPQWPLTSTLGRVATLECHRLPLILITFLCAFRWAIGDLEKKVCMGSECVRLHSRRHSKSNERQALREPTLAGPKIHDHHQMLIGPRSLKRRARSRGRDKLATSDQVLQCSVQPV